MILEFKMRIYIVNYSHAIPASAHQSPTTTTKRPFDAILPQQVLPMHRWNKPTAMPTRNAEYSYHPPAPSR
jgi:hypothetical protein